MSISLAIVVGAALFFIACILLIFFYLLIRKMMRQRYQKQMHALIQLYQQPDSSIEEYLRNGKQLSRLKPRRPIDYEALETYLGQRILANVEQEREHIQSFVNDYFYDYYQRNLNHRRWSKRMRALLYIERFELKRLLPDLRGMLQRKSLTNEERYIIYHVLALLQDETVIELLTSPEQQLPSHVYRQVLFPLEMPLLEQLIGKFDQCPLPLQENMIDILRIRNERSYSFLEMLERLLESEKAELRIRALKALANFGFMSQKGLDSLNKIVDQWKTRPWPERLMLAKLMGSVKEKAFLPYLQEMMGDESYLIRAEAAASISDYKHGVAWLQAVADKHPDRYARDMANETLRKGMVREWKQ